MSEPLFTLQNRHVPPYFDFVKMYLRMNRLSNIVISALLAVGIGYSIFLMTKPIEILSILVFATVGFAFLLLMVLFFVLPLINRRASAKNLDKLDLRFYEDRLIAMPSGAEDPGRGTTIPYASFNVTFETRRSFVFIVKKAGVIFSKDDGIPEHVIGKMRKASQSK